MDFNTVYKFNNLNPPVLQFWACLDFLEILVDLADGEFYNSIKKLFESQIKICPDIITIGLA
ncbi:MAG: hypothetical protein ACK52J_04440 [bacterium]|jgi:hypothetical protein